MLKTFVIKDFEIKFMKTIFLGKCKEMEMKEFKLLEVDSVIKNNKITA